MLADAKCNQGADQKDLSQPKEGDLSNAPTQTLVTIAQCRREGTSAGRSTQARGT
jgi:hypothetical protein